MAQCELNAGEDSVNKAHFLIAIGLAWMIGAGLLLWTGVRMVSGFGIEVSRSIPMPLRVGILVAIAVTLLFGWAIPLGIGIRTVIKHR